jgi:hypothetical protein
MEIKMNPEQFLIKVDGWSLSRGIYQHSTPLAQIKKAIAEFGELVDADLKNRDHGRLDAVGDFLVCAANALSLAGANPAALFALGNNAKGPEGVPPLLGAMKSLTSAYEVAQMSENKLVMAAILADFLANASAYLQRYLDEQDLKLEEALHLAWHAIKDRKGEMVASGVFVKEGDVTDNEHY